MGSAKLLAETTAFDVPTARADDEHWIALGRVTQAEFGALVDHLDVAYVRLSVCDHFQAQAPVAPQALAAHPARSAKKALAAYPLRFAHRASVSASSTCSWGSREAKRAGLLAQCARRLCIRCTQRKSTGRLRRVARRSRVPVLALLDYLREFQQVIGVAGSVCVPSALLA